MALKDMEITIRRLWPREREDLIDHLLRLSPEDRQMRFCGSVSDDFIRRFYDQANWSNTIILGCFIEGVLRGAAELLIVEEDLTNAAELALTVEGPFQDRGIGDELLRKILILARNRYVSRIYMICMLENVKMRRLAEKRGASLTIHKSEVEGHISPPWPSYLTLVEEAATEGQALFKAAFDLPSDRTD